MSSTARGAIRQEMDFYASPKWTVELLVPHLPPLAGKRIAEPEAGRGNIVAALLAAGADPVNVVAVEADPGRAEVCRSLDVFVECCTFEEFARNAGPAYDVIVMNPPYSLAEAHITLACSMLAPGGVCAALLRLAFIMEGAGRRGFRKAHPCDVLVLDKRPSFTREILSWATDDDLREMAKPGETIEDVRRRLSGSDSAAYAWALFGEGRGGRYQVLGAP